MRRLLTLCALVSVGVPAAIQAASAASDGNGTLAIKNATGTVIIKTDDAVIIGHADKLRLRINDPDPTDGRRIILGAKRIPLSATMTQYVGDDVRFKIFGGENVLSIVGSGISLSAVGEGRVSLDGGNVVNDGKFSIDDGPFLSLPDAFKTYSFGG